MVWVWQIEVDKQQVGTYHAHDKSNDLTNYFIYSGNKTTEC